MWQTVVVLILVAAVLVYLVRHYVRIYRCGSSACSCCAGGCDVESPADKRVTGDGNAVDLKGR